MSELTALEKHACPACGAKAEWNPGKQRLVCPYCGTEAPAEVDPETGGIVEHDLVRALREVSDAERGWQTATRSVRCRSCKAVSVFDPERVAQNCDFCGSPQLVDYEEARAPIRPESLLPFRVTEERVREDLRRWLKSRWFAPNRLKSAALVDTVHGVYLPYWTFDADARCPWTAEAGYYYYVTETVRGPDGKTRTRQVRKVRWEAAAGQIDHTFDDVLVAGTVGVDRKLLQRVEPFPTAELVPYDTSFLSGFVVEHYQVVLFDAQEEARKKMHSALRGMASSRVPGDTQRNLRIRPVYSGRTFKLTLVPVWLLVYDFGSRSFQTVVNGVTGEIAGRYPMSAWKILFAVLFAILVVVILLYAR